MTRSKTIKVLLIMGCLFIAFGIVLLCISLNKEILDDKYRISNIENYNSTPSKLSKGQIEIIQKIEYQQKGIFKITFNTYSKSLGINKPLIKENTNLTINDDITDDYSILDKVVINNKKYELKNNKLTASTNISIEKENNKLEITIPNKLVSKSNEISIYIKLTSRQLDHKLYTNKDCYYSLNPSYDNQSYTKYSNQSYIIYGKGYLKIK